MKWTVGATKIGSHVSDVCNAILPTLHTQVANLWYTSTKSHYHLPTLKQCTQRSLYHTKYSSSKTEDHLHSYHCMHFLLDKVG